MQDENIAVYLFANSLDISNYSKIELIEVENKLRLN